eukprot:CAMPEP_0202709600 /NCGR_PEP_ID=MMETSP1385-20130828/21691_1 /ASSEMBLY_ACC=CAM_ASM_000861 /TAXON_ID=933848 /ORGANISM="Elphidium margaritaceum" /LENGTH=890 /DNA_ID=CAMNT_0049368897 /DNA_START=43 /DNA_END=2715 /DNA_ORIENTATION=-
MAADSALGFLAELAAMKAAGGASTAYAANDDDEEDKKVKKKKKTTKKKKDTKSSSKDTKKSSSGGKKSKSSSSDDKKGKKGKSKKSAPITDDVGDEEEDEKTPEPPSNLSEIEKRKFRLKYARKKLAKRKRQRDQVRAQKASTSSSLSTTSTELTFGREVMDKFLKQLATEQDLLKSKIVDALQAEEEREAAAQRAKKEQQKAAATTDLFSGLSLSSDAAVQRKKAAIATDKSLHRKPGRVNALSVATDDDDAMHDHAHVVLKTVTCADQCVMTDASMFENYLRDEFVDEFCDADGNALSMDIKVVAGLVESQIKYGYPRQLWEMESADSASSPSPTAQKIRSRERAENERKAKQQQLKEARRMEREAEIARRKNISYMKMKDADALIKAGEFLTNFRQKCKWIERTLGINLELMESMREADDEFFDYDEVDSDVAAGDAVEDAHVDDADGDGVDDEKKIETTTDATTKKSKKRPLHYLKFRKHFSVSSVNGRAVGNISFSESNRDWFAASYLVSGTRLNGTNDGCIGVWNFMLPTHPEHVLTTQNMITSTHFHPTNQSLLFGSTIHGQILMWDLRSNKARPIERSNFSNGHSAPVFNMAFLPNLKQAHAASSQSASSSSSSHMHSAGGSDREQVQHILSVSNDGKLCIWRTDQLSVKPVNQSILKTSDQSNSRQLELITTCFDFSFRDHGNVILGSDEGSLYKAEIFTENNAGDQSLLIKESVDAAHYGPITSVNFFPVQFSQQKYNFKENVSGLYLTSSYDWTVKLWHSKLGSSNVLTFDHMTDYVYDVKWNVGGKPGTFACCDGEGQVNIFDLTQDFNHPLVNTITITEKKNVAATTLQWTYDSKYLAVGDSDGTLRFYNVHKSISQQTLSSCEAFQAVVNKYVGDV